MKITDLVAYILSKDDYFIKEYQQYRDRTNHPKTDRETLTRNIL